MDGERLYKLSTVADNLDLHVRTVQKYAREGKIQTVRVGPMRLLRVRESDFKKFKNVEIDPNEQ